MQEAWTPLTSPSLGRAWHLHGLCPCGGWSLHTILSLLHPPAVSVTQPLSVHACVCTWESLAVRHETFWSSLWGVQHSKRHCQFTASMRRDPFESCLVARRSTIPFRESPSVFPLQFVCMLGPVILYRTHPCMVSSVGTRFLEEATGTY